MPKKASQHQHSIFELLQWLKAIGIALVLASLTTLLFVAIPRPYYTEGFNSISDLQELAKNYDEFIKMDGKNVFQPIYETYYQNHFSNNLFNIIKEKSKWILSKLHIQKTPLFSPSFFKTTLESVTQFRKDKGWQGNFIQKIEIKPTSKIIVFGATQGALHGLVRYLGKLKELNIIDENLRIKNPDYSLIFLGNVVNRSPYTLEIFSIILKLLQTNPYNVIYLRGTNELSDYWKQHTLHRELELRTSHLSKSTTLLQTTIDHFFNSLPITLYCTIPFLSDQKLSYFKLAAFIEDEHLLKMIDAPTYASFLKEKSNTGLSSFNLDNRNEADPEAKNIISRAIVRDIKKRDSYENMDGLRLLPPTKGITTWTILSTSAEPYRIGLKFFYDAFTIITPSSNLDGWRITLYNRDIRNKEDKNFKSKTYEFFSGKPCD